MTDKTKMQFLEWSSEYAKVSFTEEQKTVLLCLYNNLLGKDYQIGKETQFGNKSIMLIGPPGVGKTLIMRTVEAVTKAHYKRPLTYMHISDLNKLVQTNGTEILKHYLNCHLCISDAGADNVIVNVYGNKINVLQQLLLLRYENKNQAYNFKLYLDHNYGRTEFLKLFDDNIGRLADRLLEMYNLFIPLGGKSFRK